jgi:hypothetical protein
MPSVFALTLTKPESLATEVRETLHARPSHSNLILNTMGPLIHPCIYSTGIFEDFL